MRGLKTRLDDAKGRWVDELPEVLWAYHTTPRAATNETPFNLTFGIEVVIPVEVRLLTLRTENFVEEGNSELLRKNIDMIEKARDKARQRVAAYQQRVARYYNSRAKMKSFRSGDLVLRRAKVSRPLEQGKLMPNQEGPYRVTEACGKGAYKLEELNEDAIPRTWNSDNLRMHFQ